MSWVSPMLMMYELSLASTITESGVAPKYPTKSSLPKKEKHSERPLLVLTLAMW